MSDFDGGTVNLRTNRMKARFEIKKTADGKFMFHLKAANDQVILTSKSYTTREGAEHGIVSVKQNSVNDKRYEVRTGSDGEPYFVLHAGDDLVIGRSQTYLSDEAMRKGMESVKKTGPVAEIVAQSSDLPF